MARKPNRPEFHWQPYLDLLRVHFIPAWILLFTAGYISATRFYGGFSYSLLFTVILIALFGFEGGMVLNDYIDKDLDKKDVVHRLTRYYRLFRTRPLAQNLIPASHALVIFGLFAAIALALITTLPQPHSWYVFSLMLYAYILEVFYQLKKRRQTFPWSQLLGRTDFALFPVAGYLVVGHPDLNAILYFLYFYPLAQAHLGVNDLADYPNDKARELQTIPVLYGLQHTRTWILGFSLIHLITATIFVLRVHASAFPLFVISFLTLFLANAAILNQPKPEVGAKFLPLYHLSMAIQAISLIL